MKNTVHSVLPLLLLLLLSASNLRAAETELPVEADMEPASSADDLVSCSGTGLDMGVYCDWDGCMSLDGGFLAKGACPEGPFDMSETEEIIYNPDSWGRTRLMEMATEKAPDETIVLHVVLPDDGFDFTALSVVSDKAQSDLLIKDRKESLVPLQELAEAVVEDLGGIVHRRTWLVSGLIIEIPASAAKALLDDPLFVDLNPEDGEAQSEVADQGWGGLDITNGTLSEDLFQLGYDGETGGRTTSPNDNIKIGILEVSGDDNYLNCDHVGWNDYHMENNPPSRLREAVTCSSSTCSGSACHDGTENTHATHVAWAATGSIEQGQDSNWPGYRTDGQRRRSGVAREADLYFYSTNGRCSRTTALEQAVEDGVDVLNMSWTVDAGHVCDMSWDSCSFNAALESAADNGVILVKSSGNKTAKAENGYCSVTWPGMRSSVLSVNGLGSKFEGTPYNDLERITWTSTGQKSIQVTGGATRYLPLVDIMAPGAINWYFTTGTDNYANDSSWGSSVAAPIISGIAGLTREWMNDIGWGWVAANARLVLANLMVMGDGYAGYLGTPAGEYSSTVSKWSGYGRMRSHMRHPDSLGSGTGWRTGYHWLSTGGVHYYSLPNNPQSTDIKGVKAVVAWYDADFQGIGDLEVQIVDLCPPGGGEDVIKEAAYNQTMRKRIQLWEEDDIHGRCLYLRIEGLNASSEKYYFAMYTYSDSWGLH
jgi:hypothetical protein